ncbi:Kunitz/Bovine pancreatic trypsin inhibitor domain protein, partial [Trichostrongylus colubriformis]
RICQASVHNGSPCGAPPQTRYYYDAASKLCRSFTFTGCGGNENNFKTKGECTQFCSNEIICPRGDPHPDRYSINKIATCHEDKHCPRNYTCTAKLGKKGACCPSTGQCTKTFSQKSC